jgi:hypothetical protein
LPLDTYNMREVQLNQIVDSFYGFVHLAFIRSNVESNNNCRLTFEDCCLWNVRGVGWGGGGAGSKHFLHYWTSSDAKQATACSSCERLELWMLERAVIKLKYSTLVALFGCRCSGINRKATCHIYTWLKYTAVTCISANSNFKSILMRLTQGIDELDENDCKQTLQFSQNKVKIFMNQRGPRPNTNLINGIPAIVCLLIYRLIMVELTRNQVQMIKN